MSESNGGEPPFKVGNLAAVPGQILSLAESAGQQGKLPQFLEIMKTAMGQLERRPIAWGDPAYNLAHPGGIVYRALLAPISFVYAVYSSERVVIILEVRQFAEYAP